MGYSPPEVDRIWLRVYYNKIPVYLIVYLLKGDYVPVFLLTTSNLLLSEEEEAAIGEILEVGEAGPLGLGV